MKNNYIGVDKRSSLGWRARITINGRSLYLGTYSTPKEAAEAVQQAVFKHRGKHVDLWELQNHE